MHLYGVPGERYLDYRFAAMDWRAKHPKLAKWFNSTADTPAMKATHPPAA
jgi:hypothetical protein